VPRRVAGGGVARLNEGGAVITPRPALICAGYPCARQQMAVRNDSTALVQTRPGRLRRGAGLAAGAGGALPRR
jgi:hypothetical protein